MSPATCANKNCPHFYIRKIGQKTDFMCTVRRGQSVNLNKPYKLGRNINIYRLRECPLETIENIKRKL